MIKRPNILSLTVLSWAVMVSLTLCNVLLIRQNVQLRRIIQKLESEQRIQIGDRLGPLRGTDLEGRPVEVRFDGSKLKKIVFFSSTRCPFCKKQNPTWNQLIERVDRRKYEVVELFRDKEAPGQVAAYLKANSFLDEDMLKVFMVADDFLQEEKMNSTPVTLIVGENGVVERVWVGLLNESEAAAVNSFLGIAAQAD